MHIAHSPLPPGLFVPNDQIRIFNEVVSSHLFSSLLYLYRWLRADAGALCAKILQPDGHAQVVAGKAEEP